MANEAPQLSNHANIALTSKPQLDLFPKEKPSSPNARQDSGYRNLNSAFKVDTLSDELPIASLTVETKDTYGIAEFSAHMIYPSKDIIVGRSSKCSLVFTSEFVSSKHFRVYSIIYEDVDSEDFPPLIYCEDMGSTNGTKVNDCMIHRAPYLLNHGDTITIKPSYLDAAPYLTFHFRQISTRIDATKASILPKTEAFKDRFDILPRRLGSGHFGDVHLALDVRDNKQLACKIVRLKGGQMNDLHREKVLQEVRILARLNHPNIIDLARAFCVEDKLYIFTELACGGDLFSYTLANGGYLLDHHAVIIIRQIALAIQYIHSQQITHRDIKPENILVSNTQIGHRVMLTDFGTAKTVSNVERLKSIVGTAGYSAPEILTSNSPHASRGYTKENDMWSLGAVTLFVLTGEAASNIGKGSFIENERELEEIVQGGFEDEHWEIHKLRNSAKSFMAQLLRVNAAERITAKAAVDHCWFTRSTNFAKELQKLYDRATSTWVPNTEPDRVLDVAFVATKTRFPKPPQPVKGSRSKSPKIRPSTAQISPYFSLQKRIQKKPSKKESQRRRTLILQQLQQSGDQFLDHLHYELPALMPQDDIATSFGLL